MHRSSNRGPSGSSHRRHVAVTVTTCTIFDFAYDDYCRFHFVTRESSNCSVQTDLIIWQDEGGGVLCDIFGKYGADKKFNLPCLVKSSIDWGKCPTTLNNLDIPVFNYQSAITEAQYCVLSGFIIIVFVFFLLVVVFAQRHQNIFAITEPLIAKA